MLSLLVQGEWNLSPYGNTKPGHNLKNERERERGVGERERMYVSGFVLFGHDNCINHYPM